MFISEFALGLIGFLFWTSVILFLLYVVFYIGLEALEKFKDLKDYWFDYFQDED